MTPALARLHANRIVARLMVETTSELALLDAIVEASMAEDCPCSARDLWAALERMRPTEPDPLDVPPPV